ncbi:SET and MYND domain-containing protein 3 [Phlyctochytrium planicorne]|nr:SET and MYND domain-containing protein 3 [Phlyctochytrium planicorne]
MAMLLGTMVDELSTTPSEMIELFCRASCNTMGIPDADLQNIGVGIYPTLCLINHSCYPNCVIIFNGTKGSLRAIRDIEKDEELFVSYLDLGDDRKTRQAELTSRYFFSCQCHLCTIQKDEKQSQEDEDISKDIKQILKSKPDDIKEYKSLLSDASKKLAPSSSPLLRLRQAYGEKLIEEGVWEDALINAKALLQILQSIYPPNHPQIGIQFYSCAKIALLVEMVPSEDTLSLLKKALASLEVSHGANHQLVGEVREKLQEVLYFVSQNK